jgi:hypothetical protein
MKIVLLLTAASFVWASAVATAQEVPLAQANRPIDSQLEEANKQPELPLALTKRTIESPSAQIKKPIASPLARSQRCVGAECGRIPSDIAGHEP